jgi:hypothetical protein
MRRLMLCALMIGCSFPEPEVVEVNTTGDSSVTDSTSGDSKVDSMSGDTTVTDSSAQETSGDSTMSETSGDSMMSETSGDSVAMDSSDAADTKTDAFMCKGDPTCDCDGDGDQKKGMTGCSGNDCDDGDARRNSKVTTFQDYTLIGVTHGGDWDCSGTVTKEYAEGINCGSYLSTTGCTQQGYKGTPACGTTATFVRCKSAGLNCADDTTSPITVKCK